MEIFARCPVAWLVDRQLSPDVLEPDAEPIVKGNLMHAVLARVMGGEPDVLESIEAPADLAPGRPPAVRRAILAGILAELARYLAFEAAHPVPGFRPQELEWPFQVELADGLIVTGVVDRIDTDGHGQVIVRDYKSGRDRPERAANHWVQEHTFQAGLYMLAAQRLLDLTPVGGVYQPLAGKDLRPRGAVLAEAGLPVRSSDVLAAPELERLLAEIEAEVNRLAGVLRRGELTPCPETCSPDGCRHPGICWAGR
jgi:RecB family exonuclease